MRPTSCVLVCLTAFLLTSPASAQPAFVNGILIPGSTLDATREPGANGGRFGFFSDIYYDPNHNDWWALSDRGPGGGVLPYNTRLARFKVNVHPVTGEISQFRILETVTFTDPNHLLVGSSEFFDGLNPLGLNGNESVLGHSFDPEGLVIDPRTKDFIVADEYGPSVYVFNRWGRLTRIFDVPANLVPKVSGHVNYVAARDACPTPNVPFNALCGANFGRQDNRGYEGLAISPDGNLLYAVLQDPLINEPGPNDGRTSRNVRIVVYDNNPDSPTYGTSIKQLVYQLELQTAVAGRINAQIAGNATATDPRQGRNIGVSAIVAINDHEFLVLERDNRGIGIDDPRGANAIGSKRVYTIDITGADDVTNVALTATLPGSIHPVTKSANPLIDLSADTMLPNGKKAEKWEGLAIGPRLVGGDRVILAGNDNDYSVTQTATATQYDIYVNFAGSFAKCVLDDPTQCEIDPPATDTVVDTPVPLPSGYTLLPGVLHAYRVSPGDLGAYVEPGK